jgi:predicted nucleic acid-binding protein
MKVLLDTNVVIGFFRDPRLREEFEFRTKRPLLFMSSVVALELFAGCRTKRQEKELIGFLKPFSSAGRVATPDDGCFREAGRVLAGLARDGMGVEHRRRIVNDVLIAVTARMQGLVVITANAGDFSKIERQTPVRWMLPG